MILNAREIPRPNFRRQKHTRPTQAGLAYQRSFTRAFMASLPRGIKATSEPWFGYKDTDLNKFAICSPDLVAIDETNDFALVIEIKNTYTPLALEKLKTLYCPVVSGAWGLPTKPIVVCKNLPLGGPRPQPTFSFALLSAEPLIHWIGKGPLQW